jgi:hypothetical protein
MATRARADMAATRLGPGAYHGRTARARPRIGCCQGGAGWWAEAAVGIPTDSKTGHSERRRSYHKTVLRFGTQCDNGPSDL